jgi:hypothetical protein
LTRQIIKIFLAYVILAVSSIVASPWESDFGLWRYNHYDIGDSAAGGGISKDESRKLGEPVYSVDNAYAEASSAHKHYNLTLASLSVDSNDNATSDDFNFAVVGDWSCNPNTQKVVKSIISKDPELVLNLGDNSYEATANCWLKIVDPIDEKMKIVIGNHDVDEDPALVPAYMKHFNLTEPYYAFDYKNIHFVAMSTDIPSVPYKEGSPQYAFVENDLVSASSNPDTDWIVVFYHNLGYAGSPSGGPNGHRSIIKYHELFEKYGVDVVFQGHLHNYQRTYPLKYNEDNPREPIIASSEKYNYYSGGSSNVPPTSNFNATSTTGGGQIYLIVGTGGASFSPLEGKSPYVIYQQDVNYGFINIDVTNEGQTFIGKFFATDETVKDQFTINKFSAN